MRDFITIMKQIFVSIKPFGYKFYTNNKGVYRLELPEGLFVTFDKEKVTVRGSNMDMTLYPYDIGVMTGERTTDIHVNEFERERKFRSSKFRLNFYMGRTVGVNSGIVCSLEIDKDTGKASRIFSPCKTNVYNPYSTVNGRSYADILGLDKMASNISVSKYRKAYKVNLGYFDRSIDELVNAIKKLVSYLPENVVPTGYEKERFNLVKNYLSDNSELYKCMDYYMLKLHGGRRIYFKASEDCYTVLKLNNIMLREYAGDKDRLDNIRVLKDKVNAFTQYITLFEYNKYEIIFNFLNNRYYIKLNNFLLDCAEYFGEIINKLNKVDGIAEPDKKYFELRNKVYGI